MSRRPVPGLSPAARQIVEAARPVEAPRAADRERVRAAFLAKLPPAGLSSGEPSFGGQSPGGPSPGGPSPGGPSPGGPSLGGPSPGGPSPGGPSPGGRPNGEPGPSPPTAPSPVLGGLSTSASSTLIRWLLVIGGACGAGAIAWSASGGATQPPAHAAAPSTIEAAPAQAIEPSPAATPTPDGVEPPDATGTLASPPVVASAATPGAISRRGSHAAPAAHLAQELALLDQAQRALAAGDATAALAAIEDHERRHPGGKLEEEREAARVLALCAAGALPQANAVAARFFERWPSSTLGARVRASCVAR